MSKETPGNLVHDHPSSYEMTPFSINHLPDTSSCYGKKKAVPILASSNDQGMAFFRASTHAGDGILILRLNNTLIIENTGTCEVEIGEGEEHVIQWFAEGQAGSSYVIIISAPHEAEFQLTRALGRSGKDYGGFRFAT